MAEQGKVNPEQGKWGLGVEGNKSMYTDQGMAEIEVLLIVGIEKNKFKNYLFHPIRMKAHKTPRGTPLDRVTSSFPSL